MRYPRFRDEDDSSVAGTVGSVLLGALAGFAVGMLVAQKVGGFTGIVSKVRRGRGGTSPDAAPEAPAVADDFADFVEYDDEIEELDETAGLEEHVLEAFRNDPMLCERALDIGGIGESTIELAGWVNSEEEAEYAVTIARGIPGVLTVLNRIAIGEDEERVQDNARRFAEGDDALTEAHWDGRTVGTGRKRQGTSADIDRHETPRVDLEEKWSSADAEMLEAAEDVEGIAERRHRVKKVVKGDRTGGSPIAPTGVPKADHVANPDEA